MCPIIPLPPPLKKESWRSIRKSQIPQRGQRCIVWHTRYKYPIFATFHPEEGRDPDSSFWESESGKRKRLMMIRFWMPEPEVPLEYKTRTMIPKRRKK